MCLNGTLVVACVFGERDLVNTVGVRIIGHVTYKHTDLIDLVLTQVRAIARLLRRRIHAQIVHLKTQGSVKLYCKQKGMVFF